MELRAPPQTPPPTPKTTTGSRSLLGLQLLTLAATIAVGSLLLVTRDRDDGDGLERTRRIADMLKAAGADGQAAALYESYLGSGSGTPESRAGIAYSLGQLYLEAGQYQRALRWFYEADSLGTKALQEQVNEKVVHTLERMGRVHAAQAALNARTAFADDTRHADTDPVVAKIGSDDIRLSEVERSLEDLPPQVRALFADPSKKAEYLRKYVADELMWRKAQKLELHDDPEVARQLQVVLKQLVIQKLIETEVLGKISVDETDLRTYHQANRELFDQPETVQLSVLEVADLATATSLRGQIKDAQTFATLARQHSLHGASKGNGGRLEGWIARGSDFLRMNDPPAELLVSDGAFATPKGQVSEPVIAGGHAYLFYVHDKRASTARPFEQVRGEVEKAYRQLKARDAYLQEVEAQLQASGVEIFAERMVAKP